VVKVYQNVIRFDIRMHDLSFLEHIESLSELTDDNSQMVEVLLYSLKERLLDNTVNTLSFVELSLDLIELLSKALATKFIEQPEIFIIAVFSKEERNIFEARASTQAIKNLEYLSFYFSSLFRRIVFRLSELLHRHFLASRLFSSEPHKCAASSI
jgi:hypothetical protein